jgi:hypothetical protein
MLLNSKKVSKNVIGVANGAKNMALTSHNFHIESNSRNILSIFFSKIQNLADLT